MTGERLVAFADILGFRALVAQHQPHTVAKMVDELITLACHQEIEWMIHTRSRGTENHVYRPAHLHFSDTIVFWTEPLERLRQPIQTGTARMFMNIVARLVLQAFCAGLPLRVGVAHGLFFVDSERRIMVGQPLIDAFLLEEAQNWCGGAIYSSVPVHLIAGDGGAVEYSVPVKPGTPAVRLALDWPFLAAVPLDVSRPVDRVEVERMFGRFLEGPPPMKVRSKYLNAQTFWRHRCIQLDELCMGTK